MPGKFDLKVLLLLSLGHMVTDIRKALSARCWAPPWPIDGAINSI